MTRDLLIARLATDLAEGETIRGSSMWHVYSTMIDEDPLDLQDQLTLIHGDSESQERVRERMKDEFRKVAAHWLQTSARGQSLVDDALEAEREEAAEGAEQRSAA